MATLTLDLLQRLHDCPGVLTALADSGGDGLDELKMQKRLRSQYPSDLVRGACLIAALRKRAVGKFSRAAHMWFDRTGLEQATAETVARHKARRFTGRVWDLCCGIGGDSIALAERGRVTAVDIDPVRARCMAWNAEVYGVANRVTVTVADITRQPWQGQLVHIDPDRRSQQGVRARRIQNFSPGPDVLRAVLAGAAGGAIKVSPASDFGRHFAHCEIELVSLNRECKEATVWFGSLAGESCRRATVLPAGVSLVGDDDSTSAAIRTPGDYLYDPDPAIVRAGLVDTLADKLGFGRLDDGDEYLTGDERICSPFVRRYIVDEYSSADQKRLRRWLRGLNIGRLEIKSRRLPIDHESLRRRLPLQGSGHATLVLTRVARRATAILCRPDTP